MPLSKQEIAERLQTQSTYILGVRTALAPAAAESTQQYIIAVIITGDQTASRTVDLEVLGEAGSYSKFIDLIPVSPAELKQIPEGGYNLENPIDRLVGGERLYGRVSGNSLSATVIYYNDETM